MCIRDRLVELIRSIVVVANVLGRACPRLKPGFDTTRSQKRRRCAQKLPPTSMSSGQLKPHRRDEVTLNIEVAANERERRRIAVRIEQILHLPPVANDQRESGTAMPTC